LTRSIKWKDKHFQLRKKLEPKKKQR